MKNIMSIFAKVQELQKLHSQYDMLSCLDYPREYDRMDDLQAEVSATINAITVDTDMSQNGLQAALEAIAQDVENGNLAESVNLSLLSQDDFINLVITDRKMASRTGEFLRDCLEWMQETDRAGYLQTRFILEYENDREEERSFYHDNRVSFVIVVS